MLLDDINIILISMLILDEYKFDRSFYESKFSYPCI